MALRVVHVLEAIEVQVEHRDVAPAFRLAERRLARRCGAEHSNGIAERACGSIEATGLQVDRGDEL